MFHLIRHYCPRTLNTTSGKHQVGWIGLLDHCLGSGCELPSSRGLHSPWGAHINITQSITGNAPILLQRGRALLLEGRQTGIDLLGWCFYSHMKIAEVIYFQVLNGCTIPLQQARKLWIQSITCRFHAFSRLLGSCNRLIVITKLILSMGPLSYRV